MDPQEYLNGQNILAYVSGCVSGAVFVWGFAHRTVIKYAVDRVEALTQDLSKREEEFERSMAEVKAYYKKQIDELKKEVDRLQKQVDTLQESRLEYAIRIAQSQNKDET